MCSCEELSWIFSKKFWGEISYDVFAKLFEERLLKHIYESFMNMHQGVCTIKLITVVIYGFS
jgi:hypothetical protein